MQKLIIPGYLPGYNQLTQGQWYKQHKCKQEAMALVQWLVLAQKIQPVTGKAVIAIACYEPTIRRDPSNVRAGAEKIILDALQNAGIIRNDNWAALSDLPATVYLDRKNPRVEVTIEEDNNADN